MFEMNYSGILKIGVRTRNVNLSTLRSSLSSWERSAKARQKECQPPTQGSGSPGADLLGKTSCGRFWKAFFSRMILGNP
jgi:hypothetical protein